MATCHPNSPHKALGLCKRCYEQTPERKLWRSEYWQTEGSKTCRREYMQTYTASAKGAATRKAYEQSSKAKQYRSTEKFKAAQRAVQLMRLYGLVPKQYTDMNTHQNGGCAICKRPCTTGKLLAVDHCSESGLIRGLLCYRHNTMLGFYEKHDRRLGLLVDHFETYLENPPAVSVIGRLHVPIKFQQSR